MSESNNVDVKAVLVISESWQLNYIVEMTNKNLLIIRYLSYFILLRTVYIDSE